MFLEMWTQAGMLAKVSLAVTVVPMVMGVIYAVRPTEGRLALMRPLSLASLFAGPCGLCSGLVNILRGIAVTSPPIPFNRVMLGLSEALVTLFVACGCLTIAWLCVALGLTRQG